MMRLDWIWAPAVLLGIVCGIPACRTDGGGNGPNSDAGTDTDTDTDTGTGTGTGTETCSDTGSGTGEDTGMGEDAGSDAGTGLVDREDVDLDWESLPKIEPHRETRFGYTVVWLSGSPLEMGKQHGELLHDEIADGLANSSYVKKIAALIPLANLLGLVDLARSNSYQWIVDECKGMVETAGDVGWTMNLCLVINFGDVLTEQLPGFTSPACSQFTAAGEASADGRIYHGRLLDWSDVDFLLKYPVVFVRQPEGRVPYVTVGFPGNLSPYSGMNAKHVVVASNEADPVGPTQSAKKGHSHVQMVGELLGTAHGIDEALDAVRKEDHMSVELFGISDGAADRGAAVEMTATAVGVRPDGQGVVFLTNHFTAAETEALDAVPIAPSSALRYERLSQLLAPGGAESLHGSLEPYSAVKILRDRVNPYTHKEVPLGTFDNNGSLATNGALYAIVFDPGALVLWAAAGKKPVPEQPFVGFSLPELLGAPDAAFPEPEIIW
ncbi:MAG: C45 family autoproteolytic acyltransferase/hydrolase [Deltaproteobacteria bacterium]|nr:C45 family autoproteolytic acyltransferase/hydrolase [Deltaproteobacteria bacterium]